MTTWQDMLLPSPPPASTRRSKGFLKTSVLPPLLTEVLFFETIRFHCFSKFFTYV